MRKQLLIINESRAYLRLNFDDKLNFSPHISNICKSATNQLNALIRLFKFQRK